MCVHVTYVAFTRAVCVHVRVYRVSVHSDETRPPCSQYRKPRTVPARLTCRGVPLGLVCDGSRSTRSRWWTVTGHVTGHVIRRRCHPPAWLRDLQLAQLHRARTADAARCSPVLKLWKSHGFSDIRLTHRRLLDHHPRFGGTDFVGCEVLCGFRHQTASWDLSQIDTTSNFLLPLNISMLIHHSLYCLHNKSFCPQRKNKCHIHTLILLVSLFQLYITLPPLFVSSLPLATSPTHALSLDLYPILTPALLSLLTIFLYLVFLTNISPTTLTGILVRKKKQITDLVEKRFLVHWKLFATSVQLFKKSFYTR